MERRRFLRWGARTLGAGLLTGAVWPRTVGALLAPAESGPLAGGGARAGGGTTANGGAAAGAGASASGGLTAGGGTTASAGTRPGAADLSLAKGEPRVAVAKALAAIGGMSRFVKDGQVVAIKPNASFVAPPEWGATTHPEVLSAVIEQCLEAGARRVLVIDHTMGSAQRSFQRSGTTAAVAAFKDAKLTSLDEERVYREVEVPRGASLKRTAVAAIAGRADVLINLPTAKSHTATRVSLGLKNLMGLVWDRNVFHSEMDIHVGIADLATVIRPHLTIIDATYILHNNGPTGPGEVTHFSGVVAGSDPVATDAYAVGLGHWSGQMLKAEHVDYLRYAAERGVGTLDLSSLRIEELT